MFKKLKENLITIINWWWFQQINENNKKKQLEIPEWEVQIQMWKFTGFREYWSWQTKEETEGERGRENGEAKIGRGM